MPDVLQADALRKLKKQRQGEEDPVIVAQRFLNIYRQLHIFSEDKRIAFNKMLLELKPEIRAVLGTIPGGIVIQDYIEELEEKEGISLNQTDAAAENTDDSPQILAAALADTPTPQAPQAQSAPIPSVIQQVPVSSKLEIGKDFAKELAQALSASFAMPPQASAQVQMDISPLISTVEQGQKELINLLRSETTDRKNENQNMTKMLLASQHQLAAVIQKKEEKTADSSYIEAFKSLADNQKQLAQMISTLESNNKNNKQDLLTFFETSQKQFQQTIQNISSSQQNDTKALVEALGNSHKELAQLLQQNNFQQNQQSASTATNQNANNIQINSADYSGQLALIAERLGNLQAAPSPSSSLEKAIEQIVTAQSRIYQETLSAQTKELGNILKIALKESQEASTEALLMALEKLPKTEVRFAEPVNYVPQPIFSPQTEVENNEATIPTVDPLPVYTEEEPLPLQDAIAEPLIDTPTNDIFTDEEIKAEIETIPLPETEAPKKKKKKKKKKNKTVEQDNILQETIAPEENVLPPFDDFAAVETEPLDISLPENKPEEDFVSFEPDILPETEPAEINPFAGKSDVFQIKTEEPTQTFETVLPQEKITEETDAAFDWGFNSSENIVEDIQPATASSWNGDDEFISLSEPTQTEEMNVSEDQQDWEWEYVDEADDGSEWEWVYEDENQGAENDAFAPIAQNSPIYHEDSLSQERAQSSRKFVPGDVIDIGNRKIAIKDSKNAETQDDPYQNNNLKH